MTKFDKLEKEAEQEIPKKVNKGVNRHYVPYILGLLLIFVLVGYFAITYAKDSKETKINQDLVQKQIDLQQKQLDLQTKQFEDAKKSNTTSTPTTTTTPKITTPTCDKALQAEQQADINKAIAKYTEWKIKSMAELELNKSKLLDPSLSAELRASIEGNVKSSSVSIGDCEANIALRNQDLVKVNNCILFGKGTKF